MATRNSQPATRHPKLGTRKAVLVDLSPAATFIAHNYNTPVDVAAFEHEAKRIRREVEDECGWMYETTHTDGKTKGKINYTVWSEVFTCPECSREVVFLDEALDAETKRVKDEFPCPHCGVSLSKRNLDKRRVTCFDPILGHTVETLQRRPLLIEYTVGRTKCSKRADADDLALLERIEALPIPAGLPTGKLPYMHMTHQRMRIANYGVTHLHHFFLPRARHVLAALWDKANAVADSRLRAFMLFTVEQTIWGMSLLNRYGPTHFSQVNRYLSGVYYISSLISKVSPWYILNGKVRRLLKAFGVFRQQPGGIAISAQSTTTAAMRLAAGRVGARHSPLFAGGAVDVGRPTDGLGPGVVRGAAGRRLGGRGGARDSPGAAGAAVGSGGGAADSRLVHASIVQWVSSLCQGEKRVEG